MSEKKEAHAQLLKYATQGACDGWLVVHYGKHAQPSQPLLWLEFDDPSLLEETYKSASGPVVTESDIHALREDEENEIKTNLFDMLSEPLRLKMESLLKGGISEEEKKYIYRKLYQEFANLNKVAEPLLKFESLPPDMDVISRKIAKWGKLESFIVDDLTIKMQSVLARFKSISESDVPNIHMIGAGSTKDNTTYLTEFIVFHKKGDNEFQGLGRIRTEGLHRIPRSKSVLSSV